MSAEAWSALANWVLALSAVAGAIAAFRGLDTWKKQKTWDLDHELASRFRIDLYHYRDAISSLRSRPMSGNELALAIPPEKDMKNGEEITRAERRLAAYDKRWSSVIEVSSRIYANLLETDAVWDQQLSELWNEILKLQTSLKNELDRYLETEGSREALLKEYGDGEAMVAAKGIIFASTDGKDQFIGKFNDAFIPIESYLRKKLDRKYS